MDPEEGFIPATFDLGGHQRKSRQSLMLGNSVPGSCPNAVGVGESVEIDKVLRWTPQW